VNLAAISKVLNTVLERLASVFYGIGSGILAVLMLFTFVDVILRYFFNSPITGDYEISSFMMVLVIPSGLALTALQRKHIRVDVFTTLLPKRVQDGLSSFGYLITLGLLCFMIWQAAVYAKMIYEAGTKASSVPIPHWPFIIVLTIFLILFALVVFRDLILYIRDTVRGTPPAAASAAAGDTILEGEGR